MANNETVTVTCKNAGACDYYNKNNGCRFALFYIDLKSSDRDQRKANFEKRMAEIRKYEAPCSLKKVRRIGELEIIYLESGTFEEVDPPSHSNPFAGWPWHS